VHLIFDHNDGKSVIQILQTQFWPIAAFCSRSIYSQLYSNVVQLICEQSNPWTSYYTRHGQYIDIIVYRDIESPW